MPATEPQTVASKAARGFDVYQCQECAQNIKASLQAAGYGGRLVEIRGKAGRDFMVCLSYDEGRSTITQNGRHVGVRVGDLMFDNLHPNGIPADQWLKDFDAIGGVDEHSAVDF